MNKILSIILAILLIPTLCFSQPSGPGAIVREIDLNPNSYVPTLEFPNGSVTISGGVATITALGGGAPATAHYVTSQAEAGLTNEVVFSANGISLGQAANYAAMRTLLDLEPGTDFYSIAGADAAFQPLATDLTNIVSQWAIDGSGNVSGIGTLSAGAAGFTIDADGDTVAKTLSLGSGGFDVSGSSSGGQYLSMLEDTDHGTNIAGWGVYGNLATDTILMLPLAAPTAGQILQFAVPGNQTMSDGTTKSVSVGTWTSPSAETNSLETTITGIADTEFFVGDGADSGAFVVMSGDATLANTGAITIAANAVEFSMLNADAKFRELAVADLSDTTTPSVLTTAETTNKLISNYKASGADHVFTFPAAHEAGNLICIIGDEFQVDYEPPSGDNFILNGTAMANDEHIQNTADTLYEEITFYVANINGTLQWCAKTSYANFVEETP
jgi:hypothetical protein